MAFLLGFLPSSTLLVGFFPGAFTEGCRRKCGKCVSRLAQPPLVIVLVRQALPSLAFGCMDDPESCASGAQQLVVTAHTTTKKELWPFVLRRIAGGQGEECFSHSQRVSKNSSRTPPNNALRQVGHSSPQKHPTLQNTRAARRRTLWCHPTQDRHSGPYQEEAQVSVKLESTELDLVDEVKVTVVVPSGDVHNESQNDDTFLTLFTVTDTTCSDTQLV